MECPPETKSATKGNSGAFSSSMGASMTLHVVYGDGRLVQAMASERPMVAPTRMAPTRPGPGVGDAIDVILAKSGLFSEAGTWIEGIISYMVPLARLGNDAAVVRMQLDLAVNWWERIP